MQVKLMEVIRVLTHDDVDFINCVLRNGDPRNAIDRVQAYIKGKELDSRDFTIILGRIDLFLTLEIRKSQERKKLTITSLVLAGSAFALSIASVILGICL